MRIKKRNLQYVENPLVADISRLIARMILEGNINYTPTELAFIRAEVLKDVETHLHVDITNYDHYTSAFFEVTAFVGKYVEQFYSTYQ